MYYIILNASVRRRLYTYIILTPHIEINLVTVQEAKIPVSICVGVVLSAYLLFRVRITKAVLQSIWPENGLIKVCECAGWSELGAQVKRLISLVSASCIRKIKLKCDRLYNACISKAWNTTRKFLKKMWCLYGLLNSIYMYFQAQTTCICYIRYSMWKNRNTHQNLTNVGIWIVVYMGLQGMPTFCRQCST